MTMDGTNPLTTITTISGLQIEQLIFYLKTLQTKGGAAAGMLAALGDDLLYFGAQTITKHSGEKQGIHKDADVNRVLGLALNLDGENMGTHFPVGDVDVQANTPYFLYPLNAEHGAPASASGTRLFFIFGSAELTKDEVDEVLRDNVLTGSPRSFTLCPPQNQLSTGVGGGGVGEAPAAEGMGPAAAATAAEEVQASTPAPVQVTAPAAAAAAQQQNQLQSMDVGPVLVIVPDDGDCYPRAIAQACEIDSHKKVRVLLCDFVRNLCDNTNQQDRELTEAIFEAANISKAANISTPVTGRQPLRKKQKVRKHPLNINTCVTLCSNASFLCVAFVQCAYNDELPRLLILF